MRHPPKFLMWSVKATLVLAVIALAGCASSPPDYGSIMQNAIAGCPERGAGAMVQRAKCINERQRDALSDAGYPYMDVIGYIAAQRTLIAERVDSGEISDAEADAVFAEVALTASAEIERRDAAARDATLRAFGMMKFPQINTTPAPSPTATSSDAYQKWSDRHSNTDCRWLGETFSCRTY